MGCCIGIGFMKGVAIVDFDNWFKKPLAEYSETSVEFDFREIVDQLLLIDPSVEDIEIRLYNGWYKDNILTNKASELQLLLSKITLFPYLLDAESGKIIRGKIRIVSSLNDIPAYTWFNTLKEKYGIPSLRIKNESLGEICSQNTHACPPQILKRFTKKKGKLCGVEDCNSAQREIFIGLEQKMVDTIIACDIISFCEEENCSAIMVVSEDIDHFPALAQGKLRADHVGQNKSINVLIRNPEIQEYYNNILNSFGLNTTLVT